MRSLRCRGLAPLVVALVLVPPAAAGAQDAAAPPAKLLAVDSEVTRIVDDASYSVVATIPHPEGFRRAAWIAKDGSRAAFAFQKGVFSAKGPLFIQVLDLQTNRVISELPIEGRLAIAVASEDGKIGVLALARSEAKKGAPAQPPSLVAFDATDGKIVGRQSLTAEPGTLLVAAGSNRLLAVFPGAPAKGSAKPGAARVEVFALPSLAPIGSIALPGPVADVFWNGDRSLLYAESFGVDSAKGGKAEPGRVWVIDPAAAAMIADLELGIGPGPLSWDEKTGLFYVLTRPRKTPGAGASLLLVEGDHIKRELELPRPPRGVAVSPSRDRFYILEERGITIVDGEANAVLGNMTLPRPPAAMLFLDPPTRAYVLHADSSVVSAVDLEKRRVQAEITTGRAGVKFGQFMAAVGAVALGGAGYVMPPVMMFPSPQTVGMLAPDGKTAFLINSQTSDVTVVDTADHHVIEKFAGVDLHLLADGRTLAALENDALQLWDTIDRRLLPEIELGMSGMLFCPDGRHLWNRVGISKGTQRVDLEKRRLEGLLAGVGGEIFITAPPPPPAAPPAVAASETPPADAAATQPAEAAPEAPSEAAAPVDETAPAELAPSPETTPEAPSAPEVQVPPPPLGF